ncbi:Purine nucleoside phosphorylase DeoD-type OS=Lysinibacillus sphaericus OX=1421 GN=deoD PE=3 SV=1 [Lysinibacillus sphaericus]
MNQIIWGNNIDFAPIANFDLLLKAYNAGKDAGLSLQVGNIFTAGVSLLLRRAPK